MAMDAVMLRRGLPGDLPRMYALDRLCFKEPFAFDLRSMRRFATQPGADVILAESAAELAGFLIVDRCMEDQGYVVTLDVHPTFRRQGVARALMLRAEAEAREHGAIAMSLHVHTGNRNAVAFYQVVGYGRLKREPSFYAPGVDAWLYTKRL